MSSKVLKSCLALAIALAASMGSVEFAHAQAAKGPSGLPLPRFVTLKSKRVNLRIGPGTDYAVSWMYEIRPAGGDHPGIRQLAPHP